jgi:hypothetical protein
VIMAGIRGFSFSKSVLYMIADGSDPLPATLDGGNYAPRLGLVPTGGDDALFSGVERFLSVQMVIQTKTFLLELLIMRPIVRGVKA